MATRDTLLALVTPIVAEVGAELYDLEYTGGVLKITVTQAGGIDLDTIGEITKQVSRQLDLDEPITSRYTLEVSSPGLERTLRLPEHWGGAVGEQVRVKLKPHVQGERRLVGTVVSATDSQATMEVDGATVVIDIDEVDRARTVYVWGGQQKSGQKKHSEKKNAVSSSGPSDELDSEIRAALAGANPDGPADEAFDDDLIDDDVDEELEDDLDEDFDEDFDDELEDQSDDSDPDNESENA